MKPPPSLAQAMTPFPYAIDRQASIEKARQMMDQHGIRHLPVTEEGDLVGVVSDRDLRSVLFLPLGRGSVGDLTVADLYVPDAYTVDLNEPIEEVLLAMAERHIGSALVTRKGRLAGIFTAVDVCRCFGEYLRSNFPRPDGDEAA